MDFLKKRIAECAEVISPDIVKADMFLNHMLDLKLLDAIGEEFYRRFENSGINKILTIEASGIAVACMTARHFQVDVVFAKKGVRKNSSADVFSSRVFSFTHGEEYNVCVSKKFLQKEDKVLVIDDFLANGEALNGLIDIVRQSGAALAGAGIVIEKGFQPGGRLIREKGVRVESLAIIKSMDGGKIVFD